MQGFTPYTPDGGDYIPVSRWGHDHWQTLAYLETCVVDHAGKVDNNRMRCNPRLHRELMSTMPGANVSDPDRYPTRAARCEVIHNHDDWSCLEDMVAAGLIDAWFKQNSQAPFGGTAAAIQFTELGWAIAGQLRKHKGTGGRYADFFVGAVEQAADVQTLIDQAVPITPEQIVWAISNGLPGVSETAITRDDLLRQIQRIDTLTRKDAQIKALYVLTVATRYALWMKEEGAGDTYSTFCDDFGYQAQKGEDRPSLYAKVQAVIRAAYGAKND